MKRLGLFLVAVIIVGVASCSTGGDDGGSPSVITIDGNDAPPLPESAPPESREVTIAKCLSSKGAVLYGADWCPTTQDQIESFKDGFQYLTYVECTEQDAVCDKNGIAAYPTWVIDGSQIIGYKTPTQIGGTAGCSW
jgi:hypothetical protein